MRPRCAVLLLAAAAAIAGCATIAPPPPTATPLTAGAGTILAVRPIVAERLADGAWRAALLDSDAASESSWPAGATLAEFIIREDSGTTVSIVQTADSRLHPGDRVQLTRPEAATGRLGLVRLL